MTSPVASPTALVGPYALPVEISDKVIDFYEEDRDTLRFCSLVCKTWLPRGFHLFNKIVITDLNYKSFLRLVSQSSNTNVARYIKRLSLVEGGVLLQEWADETLSKLSAYLSGHLTYLILVEITFSTTSNAFEDPRTKTFLKVQKSPGGFKSITVLTMKWPYYLNNLIDLVEMLCTFPLLEELSLQTSTLCGGTSEGWDRRSQYNLSLSVTRLALRVLDANLFQWFLQQPCLRNLEKLELFYRNPEFLQTASELLRRTGPALRHLVIPLPSESAALRDLTIDITQNVNIEHLLISVGVIERATSSLTLRGLSRLVSTIPPNSPLTNLHLFVTMFTAIDFDSDEDVNWTTILSRCSALKGLKKVRLTFESRSYNVSLVKEKLLRGLEEYQRSGLLVVEYGRYVADWEKDISYGS